jgi:predicted kinase
MLLVISGLPATGKSTVAAIVARRLNAVHLSVDEIENALLGAGLPPGFTTGVAAYEAVRAAAEQNLALGHSVVVDAVNDSQAARLTWVNAAAAVGAQLQFVVLTPPPAGEHRRRLANRSRGLTNVPEPTWEQVEARAASYQPWSADCVRVDSGESVEAVVRQIEEVASAGDSAPVKRADIGGVPPSAPRRTNRADLI